LSSEDDECLEELKWLRAREKGQISKNKLKLTKCIDGVGSGDATTAQCHRQQVQCSLKRRWAFHGLKVEGVGKHLPRGFESH